MTMDLYAFWIEISELVLGTGNYTIIQPIGDFVFVIVALATIIIMMIAPFLFSVFLFGKLKQSMRGFF